MGSENCKSDETFFLNRPKPPPESVIETANTNYQFVCSYKSDYIWRCLRPLDHRIRKHFEYKWEGNNIFLHIISCPSFRSQQRKILRDNKSSQLKPMQVLKLKLDHFRSHFRIIAKNFKNHFVREESEAYFIRIMKPTLNCQTDHKCFAIF